MFSLNRGLLEYIMKANGAGATAGYIVYIVGALLVIAYSYLSGSVNSAIIISKLKYKDDVRKHGSGNPGMTNMLRTFGKGAAGLTLLGDFLKTALPIFLTGVLFGFQYRALWVSVSEFCYMSALFAIIGHIFPIYYKGFKGGKGVLSMFSTIAILAPVIATIMLIIFISIIAISKYVSLGSVCVAVLLPILFNGYILLCQGTPADFIPTASMIIIAIVIVFRHKENLKRISEGNENKVGSKKKNKEAVAAEENSGDEE